MSAGRLPNSVPRALGPPVEAAMARTSICEERLTRRLRGGEAGVVGGGVKAAAFRRLNFFRRNTEDVGAALGQGVDFFLVDVEAGHRKFLLAVEQRKRESDVAEADDSHTRLASFDAGFEVCQERRRSQLSGHKSKRILALNEVVPAHDSVVFT